MHRWPSCVGIILIVGLLASAPAAAGDDRDRCARTSGEQAIAACTRAIDSRALEGRALAEALVDRGAAAYGATGNADRAIVDFDAAIRIDPSYAVAFFDRGVAYGAKGDYDRAIADYSEVIRLDPGSAFAFNNRGSAFDAKGDHDRAIADFTVAIQLDPSYVFAFNNLGNSYDAKGDHDRAIAEFGAAIRLDPTYAAGFNNRGIAYRGKGDQDRAIADFDAAIRLDPAYVFAFNNRGNAYHAKGDRARAIADYDAALRLDSTYAVAYHNRGRTYETAGDHDRAIADFTAAIRCDAGYTGAFTHRGLAYEAKGDAEHATTDFNRALEIPQKYDDGRWAHDTARNRLAAIAARAAAPGERRVALVIGNSAYRTVSALPNATNDARGIANALEADGFVSVQLVTDAAHDGMIRALRAFQEAADTADWAMVYFAGHGIEVGGVNYLVPTDARLAVDRDVQDEAVPLSRVLDAVAGAKRLKLVMLDACRDNPFASQMKRTMAVRAVTRGLARIEPDSATLVVFSAKDGELALDGGSDHSPFSAALINRMRQPRLEINRMLRLVTGDVLQATGKRQRPFVYGSIPGDDEFFFRVR
ncbi:MAG: tetratricopeptide repeat protein [Xanthobacteraceae bacterium]